LSEWDEKNGEEVQMKKKIDSCPKGTKETEKFK
jgi:hypothetical protein